MTFAAQPAAGQRFAPAPGNGAERSAPAGGAPASGSGTSAFGPAAQRIAGLQRIMFASQKGGVAKTASAVNVAICLGEQGHRALVVDTDPIGSVAACFGATVPPNHPGIYGLDQYGLPDLVMTGLAPNVDMLPYAQDGRPVDLARLEAALRQLGPMLAGAYQYVIVDTRPSVSDMARRLCHVVDQVIVVFQCQPLAYRTLGGILGQLQQARKEGAPARLAGLLLTMVDPTDPCQSELERHIRDNLGPAMLPISIPLDRAVGEGLLEDRPIVLYNPDSPVSRAYRDLVAYLAATR